MRLLTREETAKRLSMSPNALSIHVSRKGWDSGAIPKPAKIGGRYKWLESIVDGFIASKFELPPEATTRKPRSAS